MTSFVAEERTRLCEITTTNCLLAVTVMNKKWNIHVIMRQSMAHLSLNFQKNKNKKKVGHKLKCKNISSVFYKPNVIPKTHNLKIYLSEYHCI